jgi:hypothetical protein
MLYISRYAFQSSLLSYVVVAGGSIKKEYYHCGSGVDTTFAGFRVVWTQKNQYKIYPSACIFYFLFYFIYIY